jgi:hypothetical protein
MVRWRPRLVPSQSIAWAQARRTARSSAGPRCATRARRSAASSSPYGAAKSALGLSARHERRRRANNRPRTPAGPTTRAEDAKVYRHLQRLQQPTSPDLSSQAPDLQVRSQGDACRDLGIMPRSQRRASTCFALDCRDIATRNSPSRGEGLRPNPVVIQLLDGNRAWVTEVVHVDPIGLPCTHGRDRRDDRNGEGDRPNRERNVG